jgi:hypothetical protein
MEQVEYIPAHFLMICIPSSQCKTQSYFKKLQTELEANEKPSLYLF